MKTETNQNEKLIRYVDDYLTASYGEEGDVRVVDKPDRIEWYDDHAWVPAMIRVDLRCEGCGCKPDQPHDDDDCPEGLITHEDCL